LNTPVYKWHEVVIGGNLNALFYAHKKGYHIIPNIMDIPYAYDRPRLEDDLGLRLPSSQAEWYFLAYKMNELGKNPFSGRVKQIKIYPAENKLQVNIGKPTLFEVYYDKLRVFDTENVYGLDENDEQIEGYHVYDWYDVRSGMLHELSTIEDKHNNFVKKIRFYISERIDGNQTKKDLVAESFLTGEQLGALEYSESFSRLKSIDMMKKAGIRGKKNGSGNYVSIKLELWKREIKKRKTIKSFQKNDIIVDGRPLKEVVDEFSFSGLNTSCRT
tara:strand:- start:4162 stop:4980 length:819 start_codon:yes stop_codon:yes gene_type:complete